MANFFSNLLLRSSNPTAGLILRPRLPSLFESMHGTNTFPMMETDTRQELPSSNDSPASITEITSQPRPRINNMPAKMSQTVKQPKLPAQEKTSSVSSDGKSDYAFQTPNKAVHSLTGELPNNTPTTNTQTPDQFSETKSKNIPASILPENNGLHPPHSTVVKIEPTQGRNLPQEEQTDFNVVPTVASELQESEFIHKQKVTIQNPDQPNGHFIENPHQTLAKSSLEFPPVAALKTKTEANSKIALKTESVEDVFNPLPASVLSGAVLKPVLPAQSMPIVSKVSSPKSEQIQENEMVVQVHIGRIEVRAINAPISQTTPITNTSPQPKMSLDDYLQKRE